ncbi:hypothetical protein BOTBODRAFT_175484 [Botryobasidium botryosum FD-172 SS1]|uniref:Protein kinase domain-containing protein n=1 Tax=Botryobasidium botryosum (strain FD-172 SS1) TaxID=930990 RepID=A0A067MCJ1_BOTB1|nr:hypothetical protein BOTBODRAFT_175484 [Botryobasidium botryosum FD-172 SS1]
MPPLWSAPLESFGKPPPRTETLSSRFSKPAPGRTMGLLFRFLGTRVELALSSFQPDETFAPAPAIRKASVAIHEVVSLISAIQYKAKILEKNSEGIFQLMREAWDSESEVAIGSTLDIFTTLFEETQTLCTRVEDKLQELHDFLTGKLSCHVLAHLQSRHRRQGEGSERDLTRQRILVFQKATGLNLPNLTLWNPTEIRQVTIKPTTPFSVSRGLYMDDQKVALTHFPTYTDESVLSERNISRWSELRNQYIMPLYGMCCGEDVIPQTHRREDQWLVSPWYRNGSARKYLGSKSSADRIITCLEIAYGLQHLHSLEPPIVYGVMRGNRILISDDGTAMLGGLMDYTYLRRLKLGWSYPGGPFCHGGLDDWVQWAAPEILGKDPKATIASDVWSWAMTTLELLADDIPFPGVEASELRKPYYSSPALDSNMWSLLESCWHADPQKRPSIDAVVERMEELCTIHCSKRRRSLRARLHGHRFD